MQPKYENSVLRVALDPEVIRVFEIFEVNVCNERLRSDKNLQQSEL